VGGEIHGQAAPEEEVVRITGTVVDARTGEPLAGVRVRLDGGAERVTDAEGRFAWEALERGRYWMLAGKSGYTTVAGDLDVLRPGALVLRLEPGAEGAGDAATREGRARLVGRVVDAGSGRPLPEVAVTLVETGERQVTDPGGRFRFSRSTPGRYGISVERLGYASRVRTVELRDGEALSVTLGISPDPIPLEGVEVEVESRSLALSDAGFYDRRRQGVGTFLGPEDLAPYRAGRISDAVRDVPGVRITAAPGFNQYVPGVVLRGGRQGRRSSEGGCGPLLYIDDVPIGQTPGSGPLILDDYLDPQAVAGMEVYQSAAEVPLRYDAPGAGCGVIVAWTGR
jgi:5-hydroxyisourate hydrolase-like protein (transthyretin family)